MSKIRPEDITDPQYVIHPCLDWVHGQLIVGANLRDGETCIVSSKQGLMEPSGLGVICSEGRKFNGAVSRKVAEEFSTYLETPLEKRLPENGVKLIDDVAAYLKTFVVFPQPWFPELLATWVLGTYVFPVFQTYPYLWITSPEPGCGKSLLGGVIADLSFNGEFMVAPTEAQLFHLPEASRGVQVWDEVECQEETEKKRFHNLRPVLLNGYRNGGAVPRQTGKGFQVSTKFHLFCPRVLIGLTKLPEPALQRTIQVRLAKRTSSQEVLHYIRSEHIDDQLRVRERCLLWALETADEVYSYYRNRELRKETELLLGVGRASDDIWFPLFAVACAAGSSKDTLKDAAKELAGAANPKVLVCPNAADDYRPISTQVNLNTVLSTALNLLQYDSLPPNELAKKVEHACGLETNSQIISKGLAKLGIRAKKKKGRRMFAPSNMN